MSVENLIDTLAKEVKGEKGSEKNILIFTLSTCMWCKKCKGFLDDRKMKYRYIDVDKIERADKSKLIDYLQSTYNSRISYPFLVCEKGHVVGYNPNKYEELLES
ncbi:MAG: glutaredoxin family protein [Candidatus Lokiarchaeota archaeon]|nr:glutaredoxin family protein [Candidatus Lokiarchaeota archaeon]